MAIDDTFVGQILLFPFNFAPQGFALCRGQLLPIASNTALFSLLGTTYGGNGTTTFALPDLQGRLPLKFGQGPGLSAYSQGQTGGTDTVTLAANEMPAHTHTLNVASLTATANCKNAAANQLTPMGNVPAIDVGGAVTYSSATSDANMNTAAITMGGTITAGIGGGSQPHDNHQPSLALNYCIALQGVYPSRP
jgi:microcystin-dependent protein